MNKLSFAFLLTLILMGCKVDAQHVDTVCGCNVCVGMGAGAFLTTGRYNVVFKEHGLSTCDTCSFAFIIDPNLKMNGNKSYFLIRPMLLHFLQSEERTLKKNPWLKRDEEYREYLYREIVELLQRYNNSPDYNIN
jgi:hypothetical protein